MDRQEIIAVLDQATAGQHRGSDTAEVRAYRETLADALMKLAAQPVATRDQLAKVLDPDAFDENKPRSKQPAAVIQWAARQHMAYEGADRLLVAGVFREPPTREGFDQAVQRAYRAGWDAARYYPHKRPPQLSIDWSASPVLIADVGHTVVRTELG